MIKYFKGRRIIKKVKYFVLTKKVARKPASAVVPIGANAAYGGKSMYEAKEPVT